MALGPTVVLLLLFLAVAAGATIVLAVRHRLAFRIAVRNVRRGRARTALLIAGLLVGTTIVAGSLVVGDTVQQLSVHYSLLGAGYVDEAIYANSSQGGFAYLPYSAYSQTVSRTSGYGGIAGITPEIVDLAAAYDNTSGLPETNLNLIGVNGNQSSWLGSFVADNGTSVSGPSAGKVLLDDQAAQALNATTGDTITIFGRAAAVLTVEAVVQENVRGAFITAGLSPGNVFVDLAGAQQLENASGKINYIAVTNTGTQAAGAANSDNVSAYLNTTLAPVLSSTGATVHTPLETALKVANQSGQGLLTIFLVLGLFSIVAGAMLIVGIFVMLAEERKGEMGMLRAIGLRRRELVYTYYFEGVTYAAGSAFAGTALGVGVGYFLVYLAGAILSGEGIPRDAIVQSFTVSLSSMIIAYVVGFLLTLVTVVVACRRASRLNIVRAIRDLPEPPPAVRVYTFLAYLGGALLVAGALVLAVTFRGASDISLPISMGALAILGAGLVAARFWKNRPVFTVAGAALVVWGGFEPLHTWLLGSSHTGGIFVVFVVGIIMVGGTLIVFLFNAPLLAEIVRRSLGRRSDASPVVRIGLNYPTRQSTRTVVSLTIFSLVVFTMVATATFGATLEGNLNHTVALESGGYSFFGFSQSPMPSLWNRIEANATLAPLFANAVAVVQGEVGVTVPGFSGNPYTDQIYAPPANLTGPASFYGTNQFGFSATEGGMSAAATFAELASRSDVAIVDQTYAPPTSSVSGGGPAAPHPTLGVGTVVRLGAPGSNRTANVTVIGILSESIVTGVWVNNGTAAALGYNRASAYLLTVAPGVSTTHAAQEAKRAFFAAGLVLFDIRALLATSVDTTEGFVGLLEIFVGMGLAVGIAAMGILALRAVVERRREIGMLRAAGFTQRMVLKAFFLEYSFVTLLGVGIGVVLGLLIVYNLSVGPSAAAAGITSFDAPWLTVAEIAVLAYALVLVAIVGPSVRAARLPPAVAVRSTE